MISMKILKKAKLVLIIVGVIIIALALSYGWFSVCYAKKIYPGVKIGELDFSGLNKEKAKELLSEKKDSVKDAEIIFKYQNKEYKIIGSDLELDYDLDKTVDSLYKTGRDQDFWQNLSARTKMIFSDQNLLANYNFSKEKLNSFLFPIFSQIEIPVIDSNFQYKDGKIEVLPEQTGNEISRFQLDRDLEKTIGELFHNNQIELLVETKNPKITKDDVEELKNKIERVLSDDIKLKSEAKNITIEKENIAKWIDLVAISENSKQSGLVKTVKASSSPYQPKININEGKIKIFVENIAKNINKEAQNAKLTFSGGKASIFQNGEKGYELDKEKTIKAIFDLLISRLQVAGINSEDNNINTNKEINLPLSIIDPEVNDQNINELGLKELIASGTTDFRKSPQNRIYNIKHGAELFNGVLIKPGETLSAIFVIGNPSAETGFLPELVIKEHETKPEYGGGLCQVSTTLFRAALNAGLEIVERTNHSYRVSYYEPPVGMDATVYYPGPDLKIKNNTPAYILIQTSVTGSKITFDFYGTKDGRKIEISEPTLYDVSNPPAPLYAESADLAQGEIKKLESAHNGGKSDFHYKVIVNGKVITEQNFHSFYKSWQARYLYGPGTTIPGQGDSQPQPTETSTQEPENTQPQPSPEPSTSSPSPTSVPTSTSTPTTTATFSPSPTTTL